ncbi:MAG: dephospho-CoA kinase [Candidatus Margulisiibacteriota bacterium]
MIIGLTGPIASGKDELAKLFMKNGAYVLDVDKVAHELYSVHSPVWQKLVAAFGSKVLNRGGIINRKKLGAIVFSDKAAMHRLNKIVHPALKEAVINLIQEHPTLIVINAAVLKEIGLIEIVDQVWVVMASRERRLKRLLRKGSSKENALKRINSQLPQKEYLEMADVLIKNDGSLKEFHKKADQEMIKINAAV